jgi:GNAT superfamily N-acetyltransferase
MAGFAIEEVTDMDTAWPEVESLLSGIIEYHEPIDSRRPSENWPERWRGHLTGRQDGIFILARSEDGSAIAFMDGSVFRDPGIFDEVFGYIDDAFVRADHRANGVGSALLDRFEAWSRSQGATVIRLEVVAANELGMSFWTRAGFEVERHVMHKELKKGPL